MNKVHGTHKASKFASEDVISSMPEDVITNIMDLSPIKYAVWTGILSRNWRFKWNMLKKLVFYEGFSKECNFDWEDLSRLLLHLRGPITKFVLYIPNDKLLHVEDIKIWVMFLYRKGIKEITLINKHQIPLELPTHLFSCRDLKHLKLRNCCLHPPPDFRGFPNLLSLGLCQVTLESGNFRQIITRCPLLEILKIWYDTYLGQFKQVDIAKLKNLKVLSLALGKLDSIAITGSSIFKLGGYLPKLQVLCLDFRKCKFLGDAGAASARKWVRTAFPCLEILTLYPIHFGSGFMLSFMLSFAYEMIWGSPNLQTLNITATYKDDVKPRTRCFPDVDYDKLGQLQLRHVVFEYVRGSEDEIYLIKYLLGCSPFLKKMVICPDSSRFFNGDNGKLMFASKLLKLHRASTIAEIDYCLV